MSVPLTDDQAHVLLDAVNELVDAIDRDEVKPWEGYDYDEDNPDPKTTEQGYLGLLAELKAYGSAVLGG